MGEDTSPGCFDLRLSRLFAGTRAALSMNTHSCNRQLNIFAFSSYFCYPESVVPSSPQPEQVNWLFLDMNSYFASVEQEVRPELRGKPTAVVTVDVDSTVCIAASYEAKKFGVSTGTQLGEARRKCPDLQVVEARHQLYVEYHET